MFLPVSNTRAARQAKAEASRFRLWRWVEKSRMESSHSPNPRRHWNLCSTKPLQNTSLSSDSIDLRETARETERGGKREGLVLWISLKSLFSFRSLLQWNAAFSLMYCKYGLGYWGKETITIKTMRKPGSTVCALTHKQDTHQTQACSWLRLCFPNYSILKHSCISFWQGGVKG